jgi:hypothetical protein
MSDYLLVHGGFNGGWVWDDVAERLDHAFAVPSTAPHRTHPTTYVMATAETEASVAAQEASAANADYVVRIAAAHMAQLSRPGELADALRRI